MVDAVVAAGFTAETWPMFLQRSKLETELAEIESDARNLQSAQDVDNAAHQAAMLANAEAQQLKQSEIDAL